MAASLEFMTRKRKEVERSAPGGGSGEAINQYFILDGSTKPEFLGVEDVMEITGWSKHIVLKLFNTEGFPYTDFGKTKLVLWEAFKAYFMESHTRENTAGWLESETE